MAYDILLKHWRITRQYTRLVQRLEHLKKQFDGYPHVIHPGLGPQCKAAITLAKRYGSMPILDGNSVTLISHTNDVIRRLTADIEKAKEHVHMLFFIFRNDDTDRQMEYLHNSHVTALSDWQKRGSFKRMVHDVAKLFSPLL